MDTGSPLILIIGPVVAGVVALALRNYRRASIIAGLVFLGLLELLLWLAAPGEGLFADNTAALYGREAVLTALVRSLFLFIYPALGLLFALIWFRPAGRAIIPLGLLALSPLAAALMVSPPGFGAVSLVLAVAIVLPILYGGRIPATAATWRYYLLTAIALMPLLLLATQPIASETSTWVVPLLAALIWFGAFPFHIWAVGLGRQVSLPALALVLGVIQIVGAVFILTLLDTVPAARTSAEFQAAIRWSAVLTALVAVFLMGQAATWRALIVGVILLDMGFTSVAALAPGVDGLLIALPSLISRYLGLLLLALAMDRPAPGGTLESRHHRWLVTMQPVLLFVGCLMLVGLPLTAGFSGRWAQVILVGRGSGVMPAAILALTLGLATFFVIRATLQLSPGTGESKTFSPRGRVVFTITLLGIAVLLGLFPDLLIGLVSRMLGMV